MQYGSLIECDYESFLSKFLKCKAHGILVYFKHNYSKQFLASENVAPFGSTKYGPLRGSICPIYYWSDTLDTVNKIIKVMTLELTIHKYLGLVHRATNLHICVNLICPYLKGVEA